MKLQKVTKINLFKKRDTGKILNDFDLRICLSNKYKRYLSCMSTEDCTSFGSYEP